MTGPRIVSLLPSATEIVVALGLETCLVGRSHECDYPPQVQHLPVCSVPAIEVEGSSRQIDERVRAAIADGHPAYLVDGEQLRRLRPDFILTQTQCELCAVSPDDIVSALADWPGHRPELISVAPYVVADLWCDICLLGKSFGVQARAEALVAGLSARLDALRARAAALRQPSVVTLDWIDPLMAGGNWMPEIVEIAGGRDVMGEDGGHSVYRDWEELAAVDPEYLLITPCGFSIQRALQELGPLTQHPGWQALTAVRRGQVYVSDGNQFFNRSGPRLVETAEIVAEILHPEIFDFGHRRRGNWVAVAAEQYTAAVA